MAQALRAPAPCSTSSSARADCPHFFVNGGGGYDLHDELKVRAR